MPETSRVIYTFGPFELDAESRLLRRDGKIVDLDPKPVQLLLVLVEAGGAYRTTQQLREAAWPDEFVEDNNVWTQISVIRAALGDSEPWHYVRSMRKRGYAFVAPVGLLTREPPVAHVEAVDIPAVDVVAEGMASTKPSRGYRAAIAVAVLLVVGLLSAWSLGGHRSAPRLVVSERITGDRSGKSSDRLFYAGDRLYFNVGNTRRVASVASAGGPVVFLDDTLAGYDLLDVNAGRSEYLAVPITKRPNAGLWTIPMFGGPGRRISDITCYYAAWSPDARRIVCATATELHVLDVDRPTPRRIAVLQGSPLTPRWSPDGTVLRFSLASTDGTLTSSIWQIDPQGLRLEPVLPGWNEPKHECCGRWTPDGRFFVFQATRDGTTDIWMRQEARWPFRAREPTKLTSGPQSYFMPVPSGDGRTVFAVGVANEGELVRFDAASQQFELFLEGISGTWVDFFADGQRFIYVQYPQRTVMLGRREGTTNARLERPLTFAPFEAEGCTLSPSEQWVACRARMPGQHAKVYLVPLRDSHPPRAITADDVEQGVPSWSPDGTSIVFGDVPTFYGQPVGTEVIHRYDLATGRFSTLPGSEGLWTSRWSPDGRFICALTVRGQRMALYDVATQDWRLLPADHVNNPTWSRDSRYVYYDTEGNQHVLRRVRIADGHVEQLVDLDSFPTVASAGWSGVTWDGSPLILKETGAPQLFALHLEYR